MTLAMALQHAAAPVLTATPRAWLELQQQRHTNTRNSNCAWVHKHHLWARCKCPARPPVASAAAGLHNCCLKSARRASSTLSSSQLHRDLQVHCPLVGVPVASVLPRSALAPRQRLQRMHRLFRAASGTKLREACVRHLYMKPCLCCKAQVWHERD